MLIACILAFEPSIFFRITLFRYPFKDFYSFFRLGTYKSSPATRDGLACDSRRSGLFDLSQRGDAAERRAKFVWAECRPKRAPPQRGFLSVFFLYNRREGHVIIAARNRARTSLFFSSSHILLLCYRDCAKRPILLQYCVTPKPRRALVINHSAKHAIIVALSWRKNKRFFYS